MAQVTWQRAQGVDTSTKFPRSKSDRASVSNAGISSLPWRPCITTLFTQSRQHLGVRHHSTPPEVLFPCISESEQSLIHSGVFMGQTWNLPRMLERIGSRECQCLEPFLTFLGQFLSSFCNFAVRATAIAAVIKGVNLVCIA